MDYITKPKEMTAENQRKMIFSLKKAYPMLRVGVIGKSLCQRGIFSLSIGKSENPLLIAAAFHGQEWLTSLLALRFAELLLCSKTCGAPLWGISAAGITREVIIIPCVNPDGVEIALHGSDAALKYKPLVEDVAENTRKWQANARGVDINHNFNAGWCELKKREISRNIKSPAPTRFGGNCPESEPETRALTKFCRSVDFERALSLHSQGREIYCSFGKHTPVLSFRLASVFSQASGYNIAFPEDIATGGGFKDWFIDCFRRPALTVEMGMGENPLPLSDFESEYEILRKILSLGVVV